MAEPEEQSLLIPMQIQNNRTELIRNRNKSKSTVLWPLTADQRIQWAEDTHLILINAIKRNSAVLNVETKSEERERGWIRIIKTMEEAGMPPCTVHALQSKWRRIKGKAMQNIARYRKQKWNKVKNIAPLSCADQAVLELFNEMKVMFKNQTVRRNTLDSLPAVAFSPSPKRKIALPRASPKETAKPSSSKNLRLRKRALSMYVDRNETMDKSDESFANEPNERNGPVNEMINKFQHFEKLELRSNTPRVCLRSLPLQNGNVRTPSHESLANSATRFTTSSNINSQPPSLANGMVSKKLLELQEEAAMHEVEYKKLLRQHELDRMELERQFYRKKLALVELKIRVKNLKIGILQKNH